VNGEMENIQREEVVEDIKDIVEKDSEQLNDEPRETVDIFEILKIVSPGSQLRVAIDDIVKAKRGALIVIMNNNFPPILEGGFKVNCRFTHQKLFELCKMDGAVILSEDLKKILYANVLLIADPSIPSGETGTRHKAAERAARQAKTMTIAISERKSTITLYYADTRYVLRNAEEILRRATETLQILEKQREIYDELLTNLNVLEVTGLVSVSDVCSILQRSEMITRISDTIKKNLVELGREGNIVKMRLRELTREMDKTEQFIMKDYTNKLERTKELISAISFDDLIDTDGMSKLIFNRSSDENIQPRGYRFLKKTSLSEEDITSFILNFKNLNNLLNTGTEDLVKVLKDGDFAKQFQKDLSNLKEAIMVGKKI
jgi:diadenylate cyclase